MPIVSPETKKNYFIARCRLKTSSGDLKRAVDPHAHIGTEDELARACGVSHGWCLWCVNQPIYGIPPVDRGFEATAEDRF